MHDVQSVHMSHQIGLVRESRALRAVLGNIHAEGLHFCAFIVHCIAAHPFAICNAPTAINNID